MTMPADPTAASSHLYRKEATRHLTVPERFDRAMTVTSPLNWLALSVILLLLLLVGAWSIWGSIPRTVTGEGLLIRDSSFGIMEVTASSRGDVVSVFKSVGDRVSVGETVAEIEQPVLEKELEGLRESLRLAKHHDEMQSVAEQARLDILQEKLNNQEKLLEIAAITQTTVLETRNAIAALRERAQRREQELLELQSRIAQAESRLTRETTVRSRQTGNVIEVFVDPGDTVQEGARILALESPEGEEEVVAFIPAMEGARVRTGMPVQVAPANARPEQYGYIRGEVVTVSGFPASTGAMQRTLRNDAIVQALNATGPVVKMVVRLERNPSSPSGFRWTSSDGPPYRIEGGTACRVQVVTERIAPIRLLVPFVKKQFGFH